LLVLNRGRRQFLLLGVTAHPTAEWIARQLTEACGWDGIPEDPVRDHDAVYGAIFTRRVRAMGIRDRPIAPRSPWQNGHAERLIGSLRRECLDHVIVFGERHLRQLLFLYMDYYNKARTHLPLNKDAPVPRPFKPLEPSTRTQFSADYIISTLGFDLRQGQLVMGRLSMARIDLFTNGLITTRARFGPTLPVCVARSTAPVERRQENSSRSPILCATV
jgi:hypothetical protein